MGLKGIGLDFECIGSIFKIVGLLINGSRKFIRLTNQNGSATECICEGRPKDEAAGFYACNYIDSVILVMFL